MYNNREEVYNYFMNCKSQVRLSTYALISGIVNHDYVVVHEAPPRVVREITGIMKLVALKADGLWIPLNPKSEA